MPNLSSYLALLVGILSLGGAAIMVRWADAPGMVTSFYRMAIAVLVMAWPFYRSVRLRGSLPRRGLLLALAAGLFFAVDVGLWATGVVIGGATNPTLMANTTPLWVSLGAVLFFQEKLPRTFWLGLLLAMTGAALVLGMDALRSASLGLGTLFGLLAGIFYGGYYLLAQRGRALLDLVAFFWPSAVSSALALLLFSVLLGQPLTGYPAHSYFWFAALALITQVAGYLAINYALGHLPASIVSPTMLGQPVLTALLAGPLLAETLGLWQVVGGIAVLGGVYLVHRSQRRNEKEGLEDVTTSGAESLGRALR